MTLSTGDIIRINGDEFEVGARIQSSLGWWLIDRGITLSHHGLQWYPDDVLSRLYSEGKLVFIYQKSLILGGGNDHNHQWERYTGITKIDEYCRCGAKRNVDWRTLGEDKRQVTKGR